MKLMEFPKGLTERSLKKGQFTKEWGELREPKKTAEKQETRTTLDLKGEKCFQNGVAQTSEGHTTRGRVSLRQRTGAARGPLSPSPILPPSNLLLLPQKGVERAEKESGKVNREKPTRSKRNLRLGNDNKNKNMKLKGENNDQFKILKFIK